VLTPIAGWGSLLALAMLWAAVCGRRAAPMRILALGAALLGVSWALVLAVCGVRL